MLRYGALWLSMASSTSSVYKLWYKCFCSGCENGLRELYVVEEDQIQDLSQDCCGNLCPNLPCQAIMKHAARAKILAAGSPEVPEVHERWFKVQSTKSWALYPETTRQFFCDYDLF